MNYRINAPLSATIFYELNFCNIDRNSNYCIDKAIQLYFYTPNSIASIVQHFIPYSTRLLHMLEAPDCLLQEMKSIRKEIISIFLKQLKHILLTKVGL